MRNVRVINIKLISVRHCPQVCAQVSISWAVNVVCPLGANAFIPTLIDIPLSATNYTRWKIGSETYVQSIVILPARVTQ